MAQENAGAHALPYLVVDAHYEKVRYMGRVRSTAVFWVVGVTEEGYREHIGVWLGGSESSDNVRPCVSRSRAARPDWRAVRRFR